MWGKCVAIGGLLFWFTTLAFAQTEKGQLWKIELRSDNDSYLFYRSDRYYSSGMFLGVHKRLPHQKDSKKILHLQLAHKIYTPVNRLYRLLKNYDRPYAGWAYLEANYKIARKGLVSSYGIQLGAIGPQAKGKQIQDGIHSLLGMKLARGWQYQISNGYGVNLISQQTLSLATEKRAEILLEGQLSLGTIFTKSELYLAYRFGKFNPVENSSYARTHFKKTKNEAVERYLFFKLGGGLQLYNATIEGNLHADKSLHKEEIQPNYLLFELGGDLSKGAWDYRFVLHAQSALAKDMARSIHFYGSLVFIYSW